MKENGYYYKEELADALLGKYFLKNSLFYYPTLRGNKYCKIKVKNADKYKGIMYWK